MCQFLDAQLMYFDTFRDKFQHNAICTTWDLCTTCHINYVLYLMDNVTASSGQMGIEFKCCKISSATFQICPFN